MKTLLTGILLLGTGLQAAIINLNTGQTGPGQGNIQTFSDPIWSISAAIAGSGMNTSGAAFIESNYYTRPSGPNTLWQTAGLPSPTVANYIGAGDCGRESFSAACGAGTYKYITSFLITDLANGLLTFQASGDNRVEVYLNGGFIVGQGDFSTSAGWATFTPFQSITSANGLQAGFNTLELRVLNAGSFTGGMLVGQVSGATATPEPATFAAAGIVLCGLGIWQRRKQQG